MGTLLQELGHDIVLINFIDKVLKGNVDSFLYLVCPAIGPRVDLHFSDNSRGEYVSAYNTSPADYIPEFNFRLNLPRDILDQLDSTSGYRNSDWYETLSMRLGRDLKGLVTEILGSVEEEDVDFPDAIGIDSKGREIIWVEVKFEGLGKKAYEAVSGQSSVAKKRGVPFVLLIPEKPVYGKASNTPNSLKKTNRNMQLYTFSTQPSGVPPKRDEIVFTQSTASPHR